MPEVRLDFYAVCRSLAGGVLVATPLLTPEVSSMGTRREQVLERLAKNLREFFARLPPLERHRRVIGGQPERSELMLTIEPPRDSPSWKTPLELRLPYVIWMQQDRQRAALVPALELSLVADDDELPELLRTEALATLKRRGLTKSFAGLSRLMRDEELALEPFSVSFDLPTPRQWAQQGEDDKKPVLAEVATRLAPPLEPAFDVRPLTRRMAETLTGRRPRSVLLVGASGVGKTALFRELVRNAAELKVDAYQFWITSGSRLIAGALGFGGWQERCQAVCREAAKEKIVLHVGHLWELAEVGKCGGSAGIGEFLRPSIERGELLAVAECTSEQHTLLERENPGLLEAFTELRIAEPDVAHGRRILEQEARRLAGSGPAAITADALEELDRLHRRYATASVAPGRPLRFLRNLIEDRQDQRQPVEPNGVVAAFSRETGLPRFLLDPAVPLDLEGVRAWFSQRVIGQPAAVQVVVDLLGIVKSRLARPQRPLASLLMLGPTGVGKTEMAKALAEFFFQDRGRMIRIDASEYADTIAVGRLTGASGSGEGVLTSKVRDQPFSVVLLDEFEKAHPAFFDLLLQVLGEGRLTDAAGRLADFRNCVVVMTSNLGAEAIRRGSVGFVSGRDSGRLAEEYARQVQAFLRPEMFNRIDSIVHFAPLEEATLLAIARNELRLAEERHGLRSRRLPLAIDDAVVARLAEIGYEPYYGARPLKRAIERHLLAPLAAQLNRYAADERLETATALAATEARTIDVRVRSVPESTRQKQGRQHGVKLADECSILRRKVYQAEASALTLDLRNELFRLERDEEQWLKRGPLAPREDVISRSEMTTTRHEPYDGRSAARLARLRKLDRDLRAMVAEITSLEDRAMLAIYAGSGEALPPQLREELQLAAEQWDHLLFDLYEHQTGADATSLLLGIYSADVDCVLEVAALYLDLAGLQQYEARLWALASCRGDLKRKLPEGAFRVGQPPADAKRQPADETVLEAHPLKDNDPRSGRSFEPVGILLELRGRLARAFFGGEGGLHTQKRTGKDPWRWLIHLADVAPQLYQPPEAIDRREGLARLERLREYVGWERFRDQKLGKVDLGRETAAALHAVLAARLRRQAEEAVVA